jgi:sulfur-carrier protein adenylyltransferase/sulfurtransferase
LITNYLQSQFDQAFSVVSPWIDRQFPGSTPVNPYTLLVKYKLVRMGAGWRIPLPEAEIILALPIDFPHAPPRIAVTDRALLLDPHTEFGGRLCLAGDSVRVNSKAPLDQVKETISEARALLRDNANGANVDDFREDFRAYWDRSSNSQRRVYSLIEDIPRTRTVVVWSNKRFDLIAEDESSASLWLNHKYGQTRFRFREGLVVWRDRLPVPMEYPDQYRDIRALSGPNAAQLDGLLANTRSPLLVLIRGPELSNGMKGGVVRISPCPLDTKHKRTVKGVRPRADGNIPIKLDRRKWTIKRSVEHPVKDLLTRTLDDPELLSERRVAIIGCGSLGGGIGRLLTQAGVGNIFLIDHDTLGYENIGRHELGADSTGLNKAEALGKKLLRRLPHLQSATWYDGTWQRLVDQKSEAALDGYDLIICATGEWNSESLLNDFQRARGLKTPIIYTWMERFALAAHAVAIGPSGACFRCGFDDLGNVRVPATGWKDQELRLGCAPSSSPYTAIDLSFAQSIASQLAVDVLKGIAQAPIARTWLGAEASLNGHGGHWHSKWVSEHGNPNKGSQILATNWPLAKGCICNQP